MELYVLIPLVIIFFVVTFSILLFVYPILIRKYCAKIRKLIQDNYFSLKTLVTNKEKIEKNIYFKFNRYNTRSYIGLLPLWYFLFLIIFSAILKVLEVEDSFYFSFTWEVIWISFIVIFSLTLILEILIFIFIYSLIQYTRRIVIFNEIIFTKKKIFRKEFIFIDEYEKLPQKKQNPNYLIFFKMDLKTENFYRDFIKHLSKPKTINDFKEIFSQIEIQYKSRNDNFYLPFIDEIIYDIHFKKDFPNVKKFLKWASNLK
ncbi:hypothetical protein [Mycoplasma sp. 1012]